MSLRVSCSTDAEIWCCQDIEKRLAEQGFKFGSDLGEGGGENGRSGRIEEQVTSAICLRAS
eukprot:1029009-Rhodomonas_salina.3